MSEQDSVPEAGPKGAPLFRFSPTIELGHLVQVFAMLLMIGGWAIVGYQAVQKELDQQQAELALFKQRLSADEALAADWRDAERGKVTEIRQQLGKISDQIGDLRTLVASQAHDASRR
jgi:hypothetical protein